MSMEMSMGTSMSFDPLEQGHTLRNIIREVYGFLYEGAESKDWVMNNPADMMDNPKLRAVDFFHVYGQRRNLRYVVRPECLPMDPNVRAVVARNGKVLVELTKVDFDSAGNYIGDVLPDLTLRGKSVYLGDKKIVESRTENVGRQPVDLEEYQREMDTRTLVTLIPSYNTPELDSAIDFVDFIDTDNHYADRFSSSPVATEPRVQQILKMRPEQIMQIRQEIAAIQVPKLALRTETRYIQAMRIFNRRILEMNNRELAEFVAKNFPGG